MREEHAPVRPPGVTADGGLADGAWHRVHPLTPWLRGGFVALGVAGWVLAQARDELMNLLLASWFPQMPQGADGTRGGWSRITQEPAALLTAIGIITAIVAVVVLGSLLSWRFSTFRVTHELVEERSGVLSRTHRQARLDRVQSIDVRRPALARFLGLAMLHIDVASADGNIDLRYVRERDAEALRDDILRLASGAREMASASEGAGAGGQPAQTVQAGQAGTLSELVRERIAAFQHDPAEAVPERSLVRVSATRLLLAGLLDLGLTLAGVFALYAVAAACVIVIIRVSDPAADLGGMLPLALPVFAGIGLMTAIPLAFAALAGRLLPNLRYSIIGTADGARITRGLLSVVSEVLPPGRVHAIELSQPLLWRPFGWWRLRVTRAGQDLTGDASGGQRRAAGGFVVPIGTFDEVRRVVTLLMPMHASEAAGQAIQLGAAARPGPRDPYTRSPRGGVLVRPFSFRRTGVALVDGVLLSRSGVLVRRITMMPAERLQSAELVTGPRQRLAGVATVRAHIVPGQVRVLSPVIAGGEAPGFLERVRAAAIEAAARDTSHRWREAAALGAVEAARLRLAEAERSGQAPDPRDLALADAVSARGHGADAQGARGQPAVPGEQRPGTHYLGESDHLGEVGRPGEPGHLSEADRPGEAHSPGQADRLGEVGHLGGTDRPGARS